MQKLPYRKFGDNYLKKELFIIAPIILLFILLAIFKWENPIIRYSVVLLIILVAMFGTTWQKVRLEKFVCPNCKKHIAEPTIKIRSEDDPINYYCSKCDIEWETGLSESGLDT
jgi:predicted RNA-binding Zn-ribbon protein involved in translation (DUF1610 family)